MNLGRYRPVAVVLVVLHLNACSTWQPVAVRAEPLPSIVRVTTEGEQLILRDTRLVGDTAIVGIARARRGIGSRYSIQLTDAWLVEQSHFSPLRTLGLLVGVPLVLFYSVLASGS